MAPQKRKRKFEDFDDQNVYIEYRKKRQGVDGRSRDGKKVISAATRTWEGLSAEQRSTEANRIRAAVAEGKKLADIEDVEFSNADGAASPTGKRTDDGAALESTDEMLQAVPAVPGGIENGSAGNNQPSDPTVSQSFDTSQPPIAQNTTAIVNNAVSGETQEAQQLRAPLTFISLKNRWTDIAKDDAVTTNKPGNAGKEPRRKVAAANPPVSDDRTWVGQRYLGGGGYGTAHAYFALDNNGNIMARIVVKDSWITSSHWSSFWFWHKDPENSDDRIPVEVQAMLNMKDKAGSDGVVQHLFHEVYRERMAYRVIMSYCGHGNLFESTCHYADSKIKPKPFPPEPFVWAVFDALADVCLLLEFGSTDEAKAVENWKQIVHRDFKTENVFLDSPSDKAFVMYPKPVLGDFGLCILTHAENDRENPLSYSDAQGTEGWQAPEQLPMMSTTTFEPRRVGKLLSWTNVWAAGAIVARLMDRVKDPSTPKYTKGKDSQFEWLKKATRDHYSQELQNLMKRCVAYEPGERITARELKKEILKYTSGGEEDRAKEYRNTSPGTFPTEDQLMYEKDQYAIGLSLPK
ncbi:uncharacterized protein MYCFIDRAFT_196727 [Pseudocercospora fijiensis CIRAD86]|uniref:non-specific serine/threonine protein kinase n=1 Tax=Pseudocercospora fijiensis (strain CIRAD86) TaxID=383855 RepID=M3B257_PSEFD|nr:uncharacterized protein MYCFIDRAFT_196727 [Pseudocercospora fijiensis CIRAD86]EME83453.1 hypothetical protein MYCFIDRAFT_196727 [Pseudocercospora fijiensis CIRAD86]